MNNDFPGAAPAGGARCVTHPDNLAGGTCTRCGNFLCYVDTEGGRFTTCESCRARTGVSGVFPLNRTNYNFGSLWDYCWNVFKQHWLMLSVGALIPIAASFLLSMLSNLLQLPLMLAADNSDGDGVSTGLAVGQGILSFGFIIVMYVVLYALAVGYFRMCHDVLDGGPPDLGKMFGEFSKIGRIVLSFFLLFVGFYLVVLIAVAPGIAVGAIFFKENRDLALGLGIAIGSVGYLAALGVLLPLYLVPSEIAWANVGVIQTFTNCWKAADGFRWSLVLVALVSIPLAIAGLAACCIGIIPAYALIGLLFAGAHRAIRNGAEGVQPQP